MRNRSRQLQQGLASIEGTAAVITPTSVATRNRYQGFANSNSDIGSEEYDSEGTATTVENLPPKLVTYPRYIPAAPGDSGGV